MNHTDTGGAAFPHEQTMNPDGTWNQTGEPGMTLRQFAAIKLKVPNSGTDWLDDMIRESLRDDFAGQALAGMKDGEYTHFENMANDAYGIADAMLKAREVGE